MKNLNNNKLNKNFLTGFAEAESCFFIGVYKNQNCQTGYKIQLSFQIGLHKKEKALLEGIQVSLNVGSITKQGDNKLQYRVTSLEDLAVIVAHFDKYPLITQK
jgi:hypothetical protein